MKEKWECHLCGKENDFDSFPNGYLGNYHPLCLKCANEVLKNDNHPDKFRLTFHSDLGDINIIKSIPVQNGYMRRN